MEMKAGLMILDATKLMRADPRKGLLRLSLVEGTCRLQWMERGQPSVTPELDMLISPSEAAFVKLNLPGARIVALEFANEASKTQYFWLQEAKDDEDEARIEAANDVINRRANTASASASASAISQAPLASASRLAAAPQPQASGGQLRGIQAAQLSAILSGMGMPPPQSVAAPAPAVDATALLAALQATMHGAHPPAAGPTLEDVLTPDMLLPLLQTPDMFSRLAPHMPEQHRSPEQLIDLLRSPQFRRQLHAAHEAFATGQMSLKYFGIDAQGNTVADFLEAFIPKPSRS